MTGQFFHVLPVDPVPIPGREQERLLEILRAPPVLRRDEPLRQRILDRGESHVPVLGSLDLSPTEISSILLADEVDRDALLLQGPHPAALAETPGIEDPEDPSAIAHDIDVARDVVSPGLDLVGGTPHGHQSIGEPGFPTYQGGEAEDPDARGRVTALSPHPLRPVAGR